jgi:hypothetical protein
MGKRIGFSNLLIVPFCLFSALSNRTLFFFAISRNNIEYSDPDSSDGSVIPPHHVTSNTSLAEFYSHLTKTILTTTKERVDILRFATICLISIPITLIHLFRKLWMSFLQQVRLIFSVHRMDLQESKKIQ